MYLGLLLRKCAGYKYYDRDVVGLFIYPNAA